MWLEKRVVEGKNYIETVYAKLSTNGLIFVQSKTYNKKESTIFQQFATVSGCVGIFMLVHFE